MNIVIFSRRETSVGSHVAYIIDIVDLACEGKHVLYGCRSKMSIKPGDRRAFDHPAAQDVGKNDM